MDRRKLARVLTGVRIRHELHVLHLNASLRSFVMFLLGMELLIFELTFMAIPRKVKSDTYTAAIYSLISRLHIVEANLELIS